MFKYFARVRPTLNGRGAVAHSGSKRFLLGGGLEREASSERARDLRPLHPHALAVPWLVAGSVLRSLGFAVLAAFLSAL